MGKSQMFSFQAILDLDGVCLGIDPFPFAASLMASTGLGLVFHHIFDPIFYSLIV